MSVLLVVSDQPGAGKTATALALAQIANQSEKKAVAFKPFSTSDDDPDGAAFAELANPAPEGWPATTGDPGPSSDELSSIAAAVTDSSGDAELTILELPATVGPSEAATASEALDAKVLLVSAYSRELRGDALRQWHEAVGENLVGVLVNGVTRYLSTEASDELLPSIDESGLVCIGLIPEDRAMLSVSINQVRESLDGTYVVDEGDTDAQVEWFQVGGMSLDPGELRFSLHDNNAVVVRGDRPDIQMSALNASVSCLVLTGGIEPIEYIQYEAREEETPVMVVPTDTLTTMTALNDVSTAARVDSATKVERFAALLEGHADLEKLWSVL